MKKLLMALLALFCIYAAAAPSYAEGYTGRGKSDDPYIISSAEQLKQFADEVSGGNNYYDTYFKLANDVDLGSEPWTPIGWEENGSIDFSGTFDGGGFTVKGLLVQSSNDYKGLFRSLGSSGVIKNLTVDGSVTGGNYIGGIVGQNSSGTIENCSSSVTATGKRYVGGIAGHNNAGKITNCSNSGTVSGSGYIGGVIGFIKGESVPGSLIPDEVRDASLTDCYNTGAVNGTARYTGGVAGQISTGGIVSNCYNAADVKGALFVGGVARCIEEGASVYGCFNKCEVYGSRNFGGIAGVNYGTVTNCANAGSIGDNKSIIASDSYCGGILGANYGGITRCVNAGTVGVMYIGDIKGGIIGYNESENAGADCYYLWASTGSTRGVGKGFDNIQYASPPLQA